jgi:hypothetical protein
MDRISIPCPFAQNLNIAHMYHHKKAGHACSHGHTSNRTQSIDASAVGSTIGCRAYPEGKLYNLWRIFIDLQLNPISHNSILSCKRRVSGGSDWIRIMIFFQKGFLDHIHEASQFFCVIEFVQPDRC